MYTNVVGDLSGPPVMELVLASTSGLVNSGLCPLGASAGFASGETLSTQHDADGCATDPQELAMRARSTSTLDDALTKAPAAALLPQLTHYRSGYHCEHLQSNDLICFLYQLALGRPFGQGQELISAI